MKHVTDEELKPIIRAAQDGDEEAILCVFSAFAPFRRSLARKFTRKGVDSQDIFQEVDVCFFVAIMDYDAAKDPSPMRHLLNKTRRGIWNFYHKEMNRFREVTLLYYESEYQLEKLLTMYGLEVSTDTLEDDVANSLDMQKALRKLTRRQKEIVDMYYLQGMTQSVIGEKVDLHQSNVSRMLNVAKNKMVRTLRVGVALV